MNRGRLSKLISIVITGIMAISGLPSMVLADVINAPSYYSVQPALTYEITTNITSSWINHESIDLVLTNNGNETIHNWYITFNTPYNIDNIWNGSLYETDGNGTYTITSNGWNQDIHSGESVTVGITFSSVTEEDLSVDPEWYLLNTRATLVDASQYTLEYAEYSAWETGFTGQLTLTPQVDCQHWELSFGSNREITAVSSAVLISEGGNNYAITHDENNMRLFAGTSYNFGIQGVNTEYPLELSNLELTVVDLAYHLTDDEDANGVPDYLDFIGGGSILEPTPTPTPVPTETPTITPTEGPTGTITPTEEPSCTPTPTAEPTPTSVEDPYLDLEDSDGDGLLDYQEIMYMTDPNNPDTDGDGLLDGDEINIGTSPNLPDTDGNGLSDFDEDCDGDGISNGGEYATGTCMFAYDSDYDGINDYNEIYFYGIDPRNEDSDSDGIKDGDEVTLGLNPGSSDSDGDGITDDYVMFSQSLSMEPITEDHPQEIAGVSISGNISGLITSNTTIEDTYNRDIYCTDVCGRVGVPISIESEGHFDSMTLTINYDESVLGDTNETDLGVLWYDEDSGFFITQEQAVVDTANNVISVELYHFSTYIVVDLNKWTDTSLLTASSNIYEVSHIQTATLVNGVYSAALYEEEEWVRYNTYYGGRDRNLTRLATIEVCEVNDAFGGCFYYYTWLVVDSTDNDSDGIYDYYETNGILGVNGQVYYSDPEDKDSDDDTISDGDELGTVYVLHKCNDGGITISLNSEQIYESSQGVVAQDSELLYLNRFINCMECGRTLCVACVVSDPASKDSDEDGYDDNEDARPLFENEDVIYLLTNPDFYDCALQRVEWYRAEGLKVIFYEFSDCNSFVSTWNGIGLFWGSGKFYGDRYYYNAKSVVICTHGGPSLIVLGVNGSSDCNWLFTSDYQGGTDPRIITCEDLDDRRIEYLHLYACSVGSPLVSTNVAMDFLQNRQGIQHVIAPDTVIWGSGNRYFFRAYKEDNVVICSEEQFADISICPEGYFATNTFCYYENYEGIRESRGFLLFSQGESPLDFYSDDVYYGVLYTTGVNYERFRDGYLLYPYSITNVLGADWHDPVLDLWGIYET